MNETASSAYEQAVSIGEAIRTARHLRGLTQQQLADRLGLSQRSIQDYERAVRIPEKHLQTIEEALELAPGTFQGILIAPQRLTEIQECLSEIRDSLKENHELLRDILAFVRN